MKINENLRAAAAYNPTKESKQMSIFDLCKKVDDKTLTLPLYQRDLSWTIEKCIDLFNYQLLGKSPISAISINVINDKTIAVPQVSFIDREIIDDFQNNQYSVVDGQQRISTNYKAYSNNSDFKNIVLDIGKGMFIEYTREYRKNQIPVGYLLNKDDQVFKKYAKEHKLINDFDVMTLLLQIRSKIMNYNYTINSATDLTEDEQIEWFEVLNNAGSRVSIIQMRFSKLKAHGIDIYKDYTNQYKDLILDSGYELFTPQKTMVSYPIAALNASFEVLMNNGQHSTNFAPIPSDTKENQLCNLKPNELKQCFVITLDALNKTLDFITDSNLDAPERIDYINYLIGYFVYNRDSIDDNKLEFLKEWYVNVDFTNKSNSKRREMFAELLNGRIGN